MKKISPGLRLTAAVVAFGALGVGAFFLMRQPTAAPAATMVPASPLPTDIKAVHPLRAALNNQNWQEWLNVYHKSDDQLAATKGDRYRNADKEEAIKILNSYLDSGHTLPPEGLEAIRTTLLNETFHESGPARRLAVLSAHVLSKFPAPDKAAEKKWLNQIKTAQKKTQRKDQLFIWIEASSSWTPFPSYLSQSLSKYFNKGDFQSDVVYLIQKIKDHETQNRLIADLLKSKKNLRPEYRKIVEERFEK